MAHRLEKLFKPASVAVVGASPKGGYGFTTLQNMRGVGFAGSLHVVHPTASEVGGVPAVPTLADLPEVPDAIAVALPAARVPGVIAEAADLGVGGAVVYGSGFTEVGGQGIELQRAIDEASAGRLAVMGPNCLGLASYTGRAALWGINLPYVHAERVGQVAIAAQSGNMSLTALMSGRIPGIAYATSLGNQAQIDVTDCMEYYLLDPAVRVVALILEGISDIARFREIAMDAARRNVTVVALKMGRSQRGQAATVAHTGTLAGSDGAYDALFRQTGVIRVDDLDELIAVCSLACASRPLSGTSLGIFASSGGECGLIADLAEAHDVPLVDLDEPTRATLASVLPDYGYVTNPFDLTAGGWGDADIYATTTRALGASLDVDLVAFMGDAPTHGGTLEESGWPEMVGGAAKGAADADVPVALITSATDTDPLLPALCENNDVIFLAGLRPAMRAISLVGQRNERIETISARRASTAATLSVRPAKLISFADSHGALDESASKAVLAAYGIPVPAGTSAPSADEAVKIAESLGFPVVCKVESSAIAHKSDIGGVVLGVKSPDDVRESAARLLALGAEHDPSGTPTVRIEAAADLRDAVELIVGGSNSGTGSMVVIGAGGVLTELLTDAATLLWPFDERDVHDVLQDLKVNALLQGYRGSPAIGTDDIAHIAVRLGRMLAENPEVAEVDINPLVALPHGGGVIALDALVVLDQPAASSTHTQD